MEAIIRSKAGKEFSTMRVSSVQEPILKEGYLKVKMISSRINPVDMDLMKGFPFLKYQNPQIGGIDGAGIVLEVGDVASNFKVGDKVAFYRLFNDIGTWAEVICVKASDCALIPDSIDVKEAGGIVLPLLTAFDSLKQLNASKGSRILVHGVGGGVGFQALLIAKQLGYYVIGTASEGDRNQLVNAGLDELINYKTTDFSKKLAIGSVDYIFDVLGGETLRKSICLQPKAIVSVKYIDPSKMSKSGVNLPGILKWIMKLGMRKTDVLAGKHGVKLIGQVTGANGSMLQNAFDCISSNYSFRTPTYLKLGEIEKNGMVKSDIGKVILFEKD